jgi:methylglutamate dehydrogenase subunit B
MTQIVCPYCGSRELHEFEFRKTAPPSEGTAFERVYLRVDRPNLSIEHWQHVRGCRAWLVVERNPSTDEIHGVRVLGGGEIG